MSIGSRIKELRKSLNLTQEELARRLGITKGAIANYEKEVSVPKNEIMYKIFSVLDCDANYLYQDYISELYKTDIYSIEEKNLITAYRELDNTSKKVVQAVVSAELNRADNGKNTFIRGRAVAWTGASKSIKYSADQQETIEKAIRKYKDNRKK